MSAHGHRISCAQVVGDLNDSVVILAAKHPYLGMAAVKLMTGTLVCHLTHLLNCPQPTAKNAPSSCHAALFCSQNKPRCQWPPGRWMR